MGGENTTDVILDGDGIRQNPNMYGAVERKKEMFKRMIRKQVRASVRRSEVRHGVKKKGAPVQRKTKRVG